MLMRRSIIRPRQALLAPLLVLGIGCGGGVTPPKAADSGQARQGLQAALDAWKGGERPDTLARRSPPIQVADEDWQAGLALVRYELAADRQLGPSVRCPVALSLRDRQGKELKKAVVYEVGTDRSITVIRQDRP